MNEYGCVACQAYHREGDPLYAAHLMCQSKHGVRFVPVATEVYGDDRGRRVTVRAADPARGGEPSVRVEWPDRWCDFWPAAGDTETADMVRLCAEGRLPLPILADRIDEVEPPDPNGDFPDFTAVLRGALVVPSARGDIGG